MIEIIGPATGFGRTKNDRYIIQRAEGRRLRLWRGGVKE